MKSVSTQKLILITVFACLAASCGSRIQGTYSDRTGAILLELKPDHKATFTFSGNSSECTYDVGASKVMLTCQGEKTEFTIHDDGSLTGPPGNLMGVLQKTKS